MKSIFPGVRWRNPATQASSDGSAAPGPALRGFLPVHWTTLTIWALLTSIFLFDLLTVSDHVSVSFAYTVPILLALLEPRPRPLVYAVAASILSFVGTFIHPPADMSLSVFASNRSLAIFMQWLAAVLVVLQHRLLQEAREQAEMQRRLVDILAHEVGTALTAVTGQAYRLARLTGPIAPDELRPRAEMLRKAVERIEAIISRIRIASSIRDTTITTGSEPVDIQALIMQVVEQAREDQRERPIKVQLAPEPAIVAGDPMMLHQVFDNILSNSIKYSPPSSPIEVSVASGSAAVAISVTDRGSGISAEDLPRIRTAYFRGQNSKGISGAGLGLHVVERLVEAHHGRLSIESEVGAGTTIRIELPKAGSKP